MSDREQARRDELEREHWIEDGALAQNIRQKEEEFKTKLGGINWKEMMELFKKHMKRVHNQKVFQTIKYIGDEESVKEFLDFMYYNHLNPGWSKDFYKILTRQNMESMVNEVKPTEEQKKEYAAKCGRTHCRHLQDIENWISRLPLPNNNDELVFRFYSDETNKIDREGYDGLKDVKAYEPLNLPQIVKKMNKGERLVIFNDFDADNKLADRIAKCALKNQITCVPFHFNEANQNIDPSCKLYHFCIKKRVDKLRKSTGQESRDDTSDALDEEESKRAFNYLKICKEKCLLVLDGCDKKPGKHASVIEDSATPCKVLESIVGNTVLQNCLKIIIFDKKKKPKDLLQRNLPNCYACLEE